MGKPHPQKVTASVPSKAVVTQQKAAAEEKKFREFEHVNMLPSLEKLGAAMRCFLLWRLSKKEENSSASASATSSTKKSSTSRLAQLEYVVMNQVLNFLGSQIHFIQQNTWGGSGCSFGGAPEYIFTEKCRVSLSRPSGLELWHEVSIRGQIVQNAKFLFRGENGCEQILSFEDEPNPTRAAKPRKCKVTFDMSSRHGFKGSCQFPGEGGIGCYLSLRSYRKVETNNETLPIHPVVIETTKPMTAFFHDGYDQWKRNQQPKVGFDLGLIEEINKLIDGGQKNNLKKN